MRKNLKDGNSMINYYNQEKMKRKLPNLKKLKPALGKNYQKIGAYNKHLFENPILENFMTQYLEETQDQINDYISQDYFKSIIWQLGLPYFVIDLMIYLTGCDQEIKDVLNQVKPQLQKISQEDYESTLQSQAQNLSLNDIEKDYSMIKNILSKIGRKTALQRLDSADSQSDGLDPKLLAIEKKIKDYKIEVGDKRFEHQMKAFKTLVTNPDKSRVEQKALSQFYCTETSIVQNFSKLFGF